MVFVKIINSEISVSCIVWTPCRRSVLIVDHAFLPERLSFLNIWHHTLVISGSQFTVPSSLGKLFVFSSAWLLGLEYIGSLGPFFSRSWCLLGDIKYHLYPVDAQLWLPFFFLQTRPSSCSHSICLWWTERRFRWDESKSLIASFPLYTTFSFKASAAIILPLKCLPQSTAGHHLHRLNYALNRGTLLFRLLQQLLNWSLFFYSCSWQLIFHAVARVII